MNSSLDESNDKHELLSSSEKYNWNRINYILVIEEQAFSFQMLYSSLKTLKISEKC